MNQQTGKYIIIVGAIVIVIGIVVYFFHNKLHWFGRLPGDIKIEKANMKIYFPFVSMLIISLILTLLINLFRRW